MKRSFWNALFIVALLFFIGGGILFSLKRIQFEETISSILPANKTNELFVEVLDSAKIFDRIVFHISGTDTTICHPEILVSAANALTDSIEKFFIPEFLLKIEGKGTAFSQDEIFEGFVNSLPLYLEKDDYKKLDSLIQYADFDRLTEEFLKVLNSPAGYMAAKYIFRDPFGMAIKQVNRFKDLQLDDNLILYQNYLVTKDQKNLLLFVIPTDSKNTGKNTEFIYQLDHFISEIEAEHSYNVHIDYIGSLPIATVNALRIKKDVRLTITIALILIVILIYYFFRKKYVLGLILLPALFGATVALVYLSFSYKSLSMISLGIGSVILGITVDFALHLMTHLKHQNDRRMKFNQVTVPILMSSITTATAFLCLTLLSSPALKQLGIFSAISVAAAALLTIVFLPVFLQKDPKDRIPEKSNLIERIAQYQFKNKKIILPLIVIITIVLYFFAGKARFEKDIEKSNYMPDRLTASLNHLNAISNVHQKKLYLLSYGKTLNNAIHELEQEHSTLADLKAQGKIENYHGIFSLVFSDTKQQEKINAWNTFWTKDRKSQLKNKLNRSAKKHHIKQEAFYEFYSLLDKNFQPVPPSALFSSFSSIINAFNIRISEGFIIPTVISINSPVQKNELLQSFQDKKNSYVLDRKDFFNRIFDSIEKDFSRLIKISLIVVFLIILLFLGRLETAIITFIPILVSWVWTLGIMGITGLKLNYFNIIICTLIFGLGVDYSIFITKGLILKYKLGSNELSSFKSSILISALTTLIGLGVLILAKHPALRSIASLAIIGIVSVLLVSFSLQPILFQSLIYTKSAKRSFPVSIMKILYSIFFFFGFSIGSLLLTGCIPLIAILPVKKASKQFITRYIGHKYIKTLVVLHPKVRLVKEGIDPTTFRTPSVLISNHQSMSDILLFLALSPNIIMLTKDWVWNNPVFGGLVRYCGHIRISKGYDKALADIKRQVENGYSILVFPEGSRSKDGRIGRFHKGGFYIAQKLNLPVQSFLIHGACDVLSRNSFLINSGQITIRKHTTFTIDSTEERAYYHTSKYACEHIRSAYQKLVEEKSIPRYFRYRIAANYCYKGPVLENYIKIKLWLETYYELFHTLVPPAATITDIGCGYGIMAFALSMTAPERKIFAIDYDKDKILTAENCELADHCNIEFYVADARKYNYKPSDVFILSDVLHYLKAEEQHLLLRKCITKLNTKGMIIIRDSDSSLKKRHRGTKLSEFLSTKIGFNKTKNKLNFVSSQHIKQLASENNLNIRIVDNTKFTSNLVYILQRKKDEQNV
ncbi:MAG: MMPL family transporter [Bacteroidales bacterium]|nr:MMPL family transporter [Bacteroidales bacterium]